MSEIAKPLYLLFTRLRLAELPLGLDDYALLLQALAAGRGETREELARLCRALWVRTADPALLRLFQADFERIMPRDYGRSATPTTKQPEKPAADSPKEESENTPANPPPKPKQEETKSKKEPVEKSEKSKQEEVKASQFQAGRNLDELGNRQIGFEISQGIDVTTQAFYSFSSDYLPITARQMKQNWRYLRRAARFGPPVDLDVAATVQKIAHEGMMTDPVLRPRRVNRTDLVLLLDYGGSMVPFHSLAERLAETAVRGGKLGQAAIYYFHDCPIRHFYHDPAFLEPELIINRLQKMHPLHSSILIFSDGGAARGNYDPKRIEATETFLAQLRQVVRNVAWLNPMPEGRWGSNSAEAIAHSVPMFEANPAGVHGAIKALRGHNPHAQERR
jgi:uncharacterized protein with von Willebrand factor type A (vWA) domain